MVLLQDAIIETQILPLVLIIVVVAVLTLVLVVKEKKEQDGRKEKTGNESVGKIKRPVFTLLVLLAIITEITIQTC
jgi:hypothetical protein